MDALTLVRRRLIEIEREASELKRAAAVLERLRRPPSAADRRKPVGLPTVTEMVLAVLGDEEMRPAQVKAGIRERWAWNPKVEQINMAMWRLARRGVLVNDGSAYARRFAAATT